MVILGLTGSIAMGKTTAAEMFSRLGVPVYDADQAVHRLMARGGAAVDPVEALFRGVTRDGAVDREALARRVFGDEEGLRRLEDLLHPLVGQEKAHFLRGAARHGSQMVILDIPLLLETDGQVECDAVAVVMAPAFIQEQRLLQRPGLNRGRIAVIRGRQMSDVQKRRLADFIIPTGQGRAVTMRTIRSVVEEARRWRGTKWPPRRYRPRIDAMLLPRYGRNHA
jgi:dephospho-CoA kinase